MNRHHPKEDLMSKDNPRKPRPLRAANSCRRCGGDRRRSDAGLPDDRQSPGPDQHALAVHLAVEGTFHEYAHDAKK